MKFQVSRRLVDIATIQADSYDEAASKFAKKAYGKRVQARRTTGNTGKSGMFQAYQPVKGGAGQHWTSIGEPFHVQ